VERIHVDVRGLRFTALADGPEDGPLALCLHGFPDSAMTWRHLLPALGAAGFRAVAPWMRGYAPTGPAPDGRYELSRLGEDANGLHAALGADARAVLIGHDWGASAVYHAVLAEPERWARAVAIAVPPTVGGIDLSCEPQMRRSWYSFLLQLPVAEEAVMREDLRLIRRLWEDWSPGYDHAEDFRHVREALADPTCLLAAITYYRHNATGLVPPEAAQENRRRVAGMATPLLYLHGADDGCVGPDLLDEPTVAYPPDTTVEIVADAGHFLQLERPDETARLVLGFLGSG
jgi:pimeloyl-ACP methyl ester carboxylesterase